MMVHLIQRINFRRGKYEKLVRFGISVSFRYFGFVSVSLGTPFRTFVRFALIWFCPFLPLGVWEGLRLVIVALPGLFSYLFCNCLVIISPSFGASVRLCFVIVAFPGYLLLCCPYILNTYRVIES